MSTRIYRFVGTESVVGTVKLNRFGQRFQIDEKLAIDVQKGGCAIIEESLFDRAGFTPEELKIWADPFISLMDNPNNPEDLDAKNKFMRKREAAQQAYCAIRQGLLDPIDKHVIAKPVQAADVPMVEMTEDSEAVMEESEERG